MEGARGFGASMAWVDGELAVAGDGELSWRGERWPMEGVISVWAGPSGPQLARPDGVFDVRLEQQLYSGPVVAAHGDAAGFVVASQAELIQGERSTPISGVRRIWVEGEKVLLLRCSESRCWAELEGEELGGAERASALGFHDGEPVWGVPAMEEGEEAQGAIWDRQGVRLEGLVGEHLGQALCQDFGAGEHNLKTLPNQSRVRSLGGGLEVAIASGREAAPMTLACNEDHLAIGQPTWAEGGRVWVLERPLGH